MKKRLISKAGGREWWMVLFILLFLGALFRAKGRDPFQRIRFTVNVEGSARLHCVAVLPKAAERPLPTLIYVPDAGGNSLNNGNVLRQMSEMGLAVVGADYDQEHEAIFQAQFAALNHYLRRRTWVDTNAIAWAGFGTGGQRVLTFASSSPPEIQSKFLVTIGAGWADGPGFLKNQNLHVGRTWPQVLLIHGERDSVVPATEAQRLASALKTNDVSVELKIIPEQSHTFDANRGVLFRVVGEYCLIGLRGANTLDHYLSLSSWKSRPLMWLFWLPLCGMMVAWMWVAWRYCHALSVKREKPTRFQVALRGLAGIMATLAIGQTVLQLGVPRLAISPRTLSIARQYLVSAKEKDDFEFLAPVPIWRGRQLRMLLENIELADYNRQLANWQLDDPIYRNFVLAPWLQENDQDLAWRRMLWEAFYPRVRREVDSMSAANAVVLFLRQRVTISDSTPSRQNICDIWLNGIANREDFERIYTAALRAVGIPARLGPPQKAELYINGQWLTAPRPIFD